MRTLSTMLKPLGLAGLSLAMVGGVAMQVTAQEASASSSAQTLEQKPFKQHGQRGMRGLDLTADQVAVLKQYRESEAPAQKARHEKAAQLRKQLQTVVANQGDEREIEAISREIGVIAGENQFAAAKSQAHLLSLLTPEQKEKWAEFEAKRAQGHFQPRGERPEGWHHKGKGPRPEHRSRGDGSSAQSTGI